MYFKIVSTTVTSTYSSALTVNYPLYSRSGSTTATFYYEPIQVVVSVTGTYTFKSSSTVDMYGYFYANNFNPSNVALNLMASNDDSGGSLQFLLTVSLQSGGTYILVATTYSQYVTTSFSVIGSGPGGTITYSKIVTVLTTRATATTTTTLIAT